jgi:hypothetical protein
MNKHVSILLAAAAVWGTISVSVMGSADGGGPALNAELVSLAPNVWLKFHEQEPGDRCSFRRRGHGGSCFDTRRGELVLFGSDTHSKDWINSPLIFNPVTKQWRQVYPEDSVQTYAVTSEGIPLAGVNGDHPWTTHTFGCVVYDPARDEMVIVCWPGHMRPDKWGQATQHLWGKIKKHPNWTFSLADEKWTPLACKEAHFFPHCAAMDTDRNVVIGYQGGCVAELGGEPRSWNTVSTASFFGWHDNCAYDSKNKALVVFGSNENKNDVVVYVPATGEHKMMPTPGARPPRDQHCPMEFVPGIGRTVVLVDRTKAKDGAEGSSTETWCYDLGKDEWGRIDSATLPFACDMNYNMEYDPRHKVLFLVTGGYGQSTVVWALKPEIR